MGREIILFKSEEHTSAANAAATLRTIADKIEAGQITLATPEAEVLLEIPPEITLEIKAEEEQSRTLKRSLEIEIEWNEGETAHLSGGLNIS